MQTGKLRLQHVDKRFFNLDNGLQESEKSLKTNLYKSKNSILEPG